MIDKILDWFPEDDLLIIDGFDEAIIGIETNSARVIYSVTKCIEILKQEMSLEDALDYFHFNIEGAYLGDKTPIYCMDEL
tara:strand:+ start:5678 stop:5917 length:240 start_codon:yes stop_codon:yes gene_type:complete